MIDRLVNRLGARAVRRLYPRASHIPELAQKLRSAFAGPSLWPEQPPHKPPRVPLLLSRPEPLEVLAEIPEGPPARFTWRRVTCRVIKAEGPERIAPEWWRALAPSSKPTPLSSPGLTGRSSNPGPLIGKPGQQADKDQGVLDARLRGHGTEKAIPVRPRDYYRIEDEDGRRYWVFREGLYQESEHGLPSWFLHGVFG